jgi:GT2 family glycosyltransferase
MKVSVITTVYNDAEYLEPCLTSIRDQDAPNIEIEHIIWDDGSSSQEALKRKEESFPHATFYTDNKNVGLPGARNRAVAKSTGEYLLFLDADDFFSSNAVAEMVAASEGKYSPVYCDVRMFNKAQQTLKKPHWSKEAAMKRLFIPACSMVRKEDFDAVGGFNESLPLFEDFDLWFRMARHGIEGRYCPTALFYYNIREDSVSDHFDLRGMSKTKQEVYQRIVLQ